MSSIDDAYNYICSIESNDSSIEKFKMIEIKTDKDFTNTSDEVDMNICYFKKGKPYYYCLSEYDNISLHIIVEMVIC
jgi:hypothetical protein